MSDGRIGRMTNEKAELGKKIEERKTLLASIFRHDGATKKRKVLGSYSIYTVERSLFAMTMIADVLSSGCWKKGGVVKVKTYRWHVQS